MLAGGGRAGDAEYYSSLSCAPLFPPILPDDDDDDNDAHSHSSGREEAGKEWPLK